MAADGYAKAKEIGQTVSPHQFSSSMIKAPASAVFELVKPLTFKWMNTVASSKKDEETGAINIAYNDNTIQQIEELEYSYLDLKVSWEVVSSDPPAPTFSASHTIRCYRSTDTADECFVTWNTDFSGDCTAQVVEDCRWKKKDSFAQLQAFIGRDAAASPSHGVGGAESPSPLSPHQYASIVVPASAQSVFDLIKPLTFKWLKTVSSSRKEDDSGYINIAYADNTVQKLNQLECSRIDRTVTWEVVESDPPAPTFSCVHTITCHNVTESNQCFLTWNTDYSSDCTVAVLHDSKWKKTEAFQSLCDFVKA